MSANTQPFITPTLRNFAAYGNYSFIFFCWFYKNSSRTRPLLADFLSRNCVENLGMFLKVGYKVETLIVRICTVFRGKSVAQKSMEHMAYIGSSGSRTIKR